MTSPMRILTPEMAKAEDDYLLSQYFLVRQGSLGEHFRCRRCKRKDKYMTLMCVERPYSGIAQGLYGIIEKFGTPEALKRMSTQERHRIEAVRRLLGGEFTIPDLSTLHPRLAASIKIGERDMQRGAVALGVVVPISKERAQKLQDRINMKGLKPKLALPGLMP